MIGIKRCYEIFDYNPHDDIDERILRKKYHKLCLIHHPDKTRQKLSKTEIKEEDLNFNEIKYAYETLNDICQSDKYKSYNSTKNDDCESKEDIMMHKELLNLISNEYIYELLKNISFEYFNYNFYDKNCITLNIDLEQLFDRNIYFDKSYNIYIPLWHHYLTLKNIYEENNISFESNHTNISFKIHTKLPKNVFILPNNDIIVIVDYKSCKDKCKIVHCMYEGKVFDIDMNEKILQNRYTILHGQGIYRPNPNQIYDHSKKSNIVFILL